MTPSFQDTDGTSSQKHKGMAIMAKIVKIAVPLAISASLILWLFHKVNIRQVSDIINQGVDWRFIVMMMGITVVSHIIRGIRWGIQLRAAGVPRIPTIAECVSIFGAYALNLVFPYLGEAWRCVYISRRENCKLSTVVGTDIGDRASDGVMILMLIILAIFVARPAIDRFLDHYKIGEELEAVLSDGMILVWIALIIALLIGLDRFFKHTKFIKGVNQSIRRMWEGFAVLFHMKGTALYIVLTFGIWICYFMETYVCFYAFPFTRQLLINPELAYGFIPGLVVFVFGSCSMAVPSNGGLGPWNLAVMFALGLYGIGNNEAAAYTIVCWSLQALTLVGLGIFSAIYIMTSRHKNKPSVPK